MDPEWKVLAWRQRPVVAFGFSSRFGAEGEGVGARHDQKCFFIATAIFLVCHLTPRTLCLKVPDANTLCRIFKEKG